MSFPFFFSGAAGSGSLALILQDEVDKMAYRITPNSSSKSLLIKIRGTNGQSKKSLTYNSAGAVASYSRQGQDPVSFALVTLASASASWSAGGFKELSPSIAGGLYRVDVPNAALLSGAQYVLISVTFDGALEEEILINLDHPFTSAGVGAISHTINVHSTVGNTPIIAAAVWASTDIGGDNVVASGTTNAYGSVVFLLDAGPYYLWVLDENFLATNPTLFTVA